MVDQKKILLIGVVIILIIAAIFFVNYYSEKENFSVNPFLLKLNIPLNGESINEIKITNDEEKEQKFSLYFKNLEDIASITEKEFVLESGESKEVQVYFKDNKNEVKVYSGELIIEASFLKKRIPVILSIEDEKSIFAIIQESAPQYRNFYPGGKFGIDIKIFNLKDDNLHNINIEYFIKNLEGEQILPKESEELIVREKLGLTKIIDIPKNIPYGDYVFVSLIEYEGKKSVAGYLFSVSEKEKEPFFGNLKFFVIIILIFVAGIIILFFYFMKTRDELLTILKQQQQNELKRGSKLIENFEEKTKKRIIRDIKVKQKEQIRTVKKLKKEGKKSEIEKRMEAWEKEGYETFKNIVKMNKVSRQNMKKYTGN